MELGIKVKLYLWCHAGSYLNLGVNSLIIYILQNIFLFQRKTGKNTEKKKDSEREAMGEGRRKRKWRGEEKEALISEARWPGAQNLCQSVEED